MAMLEQHRAAMAHEHVSAVAKLSEARQKKYASMVHAMPTLLRSAGLSQALHFAASRSDRDQRTLLDHLAAQLKRVDSKIGDATSLLNRARNAELAMYLKLTHEALTCVSWYRRMVQGVLGLEAGDADVTD